MNNTEHCEHSACRMLIMANCKMKLAIAELMPLIKPHDKCLMLFTQQMYSLNVTELKCITGCKNLRRINGGWFK